jgi:hypothetical protein
MHLPPSILAGLLSPSPPAPRGVAGLKPGEASGEALDVIRRRLRLSSLLVACLGLVTAPALAGDLDPDWSARLMLEQAGIERAQARLDRARASYARAAAEAAGRAEREEGKGGERVEQLARERDEAEAELRSRERSLPLLVEEARLAGVSPEVLKPYRFAVSPADSP